MKKKEAERFASVAFEVVKDGLKEDRQVKIKGLGTFKVVNIESRESINVNTGERVVIEGHSKISFTPDSTMKELVNKPFSQFDTVVLNEGVYFDDMGQTETDEETTDVESVTSVEKQSVSEPELDQIQEKVSVLEKVEEVVEEGNQEEVQEDVPEEKHKETEAKTETITDDVIEEEDEEMSKKYKNVFWTVATIACVASFFIGYYLGRTTSSQADIIESVDEPVVQVNDSLKSDTLKQDTLTVEKDTTRATVEPVLESESEPETKAEPASKTSEDVDYDKYSQIDARVRTGAYRIVGTAQEIKVNAGETTERISSRFLGPGMKCYIEAYNGLKPGDELKEGQVLKIPKLELKKKIKKNKNQE
ncbi:MAG: HU family DNA-binding protein [Prevotella sp.]|nr:HU family DNA-binding protein [Prevotella sp.]